MQKNVKLADEDKSQTSKITQVTREVVEQPNKQQGKGKKLKEQVEEKKTLKKKERKESPAYVTKGKRNPYAPSKESTEYNVFIKLYGREILSKHKIDENTVRFKIISEAYKTITDTQKEEIAKWKVEDKKRYEKEFKEYKEKGFFLREDGSKSNLGYAKDYAFPKKLLNEFAQFNKLFGNVVVKEGTDFKERGVILKKAFDSMTAD